MGKFSNGSYAASELREKKLLMMMRRLLLLRRLLFLTVSRNPLWVSHPLPVSTELDVFRHHPRTSTPLRAVGMTFP